MQPFRERVHLDERYLPGYVNHQQPDEAAELHTIAACRGAIDGLMAEVLEGHIRFHVVDPDHHPTSERAKATQELIDVIKMYLK